MQTKPSNREFIHRLLRLMFAIHKAADRTLLEGTGLPFSQFFILVAINRHPESTQKQIAQFLGITEAAVSRQIELLERQKFIERNINPDNRREKNLSLAQKGKNILAKAQVIISREREKLLTILSDEEQQNFLKITDKLLKNLSEVDDGCFL